MKGYLMGAWLADHPVDGREEEGAADGPESCSRSTILQNGRSITILH